MSTEIDRSHHVVPNSTEFCFLDCETAFKGLTEKEKLYAHYMSRASWYGGLIVLYQTSKESVGAYLLLNKLFRSQSLDELKELAKTTGLSDDEYQAFLVYAAALYANTGNYKSFGDTKIVPGLPQEKFEALVKGSKAYSTDQEVMSKLWESVKEKLYSLSKRDAQLAIGKAGTTTYFSANCTQEDSEIAKRFMQQNNIELWNTRCLKHDNGLMEIRLASASRSGKGLSILGEYTYTEAEQSYKFTVTRGDYSPLLSAAIEHLKLAGEFAANDAQKEMINKYISHFESGDIKDHKDASRYWIKDKGPAVESYIGFIETYRDPVGSRGEFEGFVAMVNREMSKKFTALVEGAEKYLPLLPWDKTYEKDKFLQPDFTSIDVLAFAGSGVPAGINIPNYDEIRQSEGFKNVSLGNVLSSSFKGDQTVTFVTPEDKELLSTWKAPSFEVQVGLHELLGHGSGKIFQKNKDGTYNFDRDNTKHALTGEPIQTWYEEGETYYSKFPVMCSSYEECRAECVGLLLCLDDEILSVFGYPPGEDAENIIYVNWFNMARAGLLALQFYSPDGNAWKQAHMQARYVILQVLLSAGDLVNIKQLEGSDGKPDLLITLNKENIKTSGRKVISDFLLKLQVYKATADYPSAKKMYQDELSLVSDRENMKFSSWRNIVMERRVPRKMLVQSNTTRNGSEVDLHMYEGSATGLVQSVMDRYKNDTQLEQSMESLWREDLHFWKTQ